MSNYVQRIIISIINYLSLHIFLTLVSLPIIVAWGLPTSWLSPLGNFIFNPFISLFLFIASLAFFSEIIGIPHHWCNTLLEYITTWWQWILSYAPARSLYGFCKVPWWLLATIALSTCISVMHPYMRYPLYRFLSLTGVLIITMAIIYTYKPAIVTTTMPCNQGTITIIHSNNKTIVIDPGYIGSRLSARSWISYTFMPELIAQTGSLTIDHLILLKPNKCTFDALDTLLDNALIQHIYMPSLDGTLTGAFKHSFNTAYAHLRQNKVTITRIHTQPISLHIDTMHMCITPKKNKTYQTITYPHCVIEGMMQDIPIAITGR